MKENARQAPAARDAGFIYAHGTTLYEYDRPFRFISWNVPNIHALEDNPERWEQAPTPREQEDALASVHQMLGRVIRTYTLSVGHKRHIEAPGKLSEELFRGLDCALAIAPKYNIRVIIPFIDQWDWHGGIKEFAAFRGKREIEFWTDPTIRQDFKNVIHQVIHRRNTATGVLYRDDPTILGWETGNELGGWDFNRDLSAWTLDVCAYIRSVDRNHLIIDGTLGTRNQHWAKEVLHSPYIDVLDNHYYSPRGTDDYANQAKADLKVAKKYNKALIIGEFGLAPPRVMEVMLDAVVNNVEIAGALIWSLRFHSEQGGFYTHTESDGYLSYHHPGFPEAEGFHRDEEMVMKMMRSYSAKIQCQNTSVIPPPAPPHLFPTCDTKLRWRGSAGACHYEMWRMDGDVNAQNGNWRLVADRVMDNVKYGSWMYEDRDLCRGGVYTYAVVAVSEGGKSPYSNTVVVRVPCGDC
ncbi:hypothetical protein SeMB42_g01661 [Synchytrium endobioticum]|uniref:mannan endo-1,4-beta-mannosidase n=1 Tax=Synchytrium endobioticum TaxID=286115 RepID=A0A507DKC1_9FUNG|nr:hypothetical protein SeMB42_g01661 [Synchytrium endobioticum]